MVFSRRATHFFIGLALVLIAQYLMSRREPVLARFVFSPWLDQQYHIDVPNLDNVTLATGLLVVGGYLLARNAMARRYAEPSLASRAISRAHLASAPISLGLMGTGCLFSLLIWLLSIEFYGDWLLLVWIAVLGLILAGAWLLDRRANIPLAPDLKWRDAALIAILLAIGLTIGTHRLGQVPNSLIGDEGTFWETAQAIATGPLRPSPFGLGVYSFPIFSSMWQAWVLQIAGLSLWSWRLASVLAGCLAVVPTYLLAHEMFDRRTAILASGVMVVTPYFIAFSRIGYNNSQSLFPVAMTLYCLFAGLRRSSAVFLVLGGISAGLGFYTYTAGRLGLVAAVLFLAYLAVARLREKPSQTPTDQAGTESRGGMRTIAVLGTALVIGWTATALPHLVYANAVDPAALRRKSLESMFPNAQYALSLFDPEQVYRDYPPITVDEAQFFYRPDLYGRLIVRAAVRSFLVFHHRELVSEHFIAGPLAGPLAVCFYFVGLVVTLAGLRRKNLVLVAIWFASGLLFLSIINTFPPRHQHLVSIIPAMSILTALGITTVADTLASQAHRWQSAVSGLVAATIWSVIAFTGLRNYFVDVQAVFLPNSEQWMTFTALELEAPRQMIYVYADPQQKGFVPWGIRHLPTWANFGAVGLEDLYSKRFSIDPNGAYIFFFHEQNQAAVVSFLESVLNRSVSPQVYRNREQQIIALSYSFGDSPPVSLPRAPSSPNLGLGLGALLVVLLGSVGWRLARRRITGSLIREQLTQRWLGVTAALRAPVFDPGQEPLAGDKPHGRAEESQQLRDSHDCGD
jgi:4-amino-4-deoxy-L-arabinose transferase-like glycosyltransferase